MILYTFQPKEVYEQLLEHKTLIADPSKGGHFCEDYGFQGPYSWLEHQYSQRVKNGEPCGHLWWAYSIKPDLRSYRTQYTNEYVLLKLDVPDNEVLLTSFEGWCMGPLNRRIVSKNDWEDDLYYCYCLQLPFDVDEDDPDRKEKFDKITALRLDNFGVATDEWNEHCQNIVEHSWNEIFEDHSSSGIFDHEWCDLSKRDQANFEVLKLEHVKKVITFKGTFKPRPGF